MIVETEQRPDLETGDGFGVATRPSIARMLRALRLDIAYERGAGDHLYFRDDDGRERRVLDMLGGYGASLLGHNHPELVERAQAALDAGWPANAQASRRVHAGQLARALDERVGRETGRRYVVTLANSGAEAVEAALKHAALARQVGAATMLRRIEDEAIELREALRDGRLQVPAGTLRRAAARFDLAAVDDLEHVLRLVLQHDAEVLARPPVFLALEGAFHGKTLGALQLTHSPVLRRPWRGLGPDVSFLPVGDEDALGAAVAAASGTLLALEADADGRLELLERPWCDIAAAFAEPIQGEGGIREVPASYLRALRAQADAAGFSLVFDEIQSGMGRTGTFLASTPSGVRADGYLLSKALGGGLAKLSALLVDADVYVDGFDRLHTSTFGDDDTSSHIALGVLELLDRDGGALVRRCGEQGRRLEQRLQALRRRYPDVIAEVRGRGLMLGVELLPQTSSASPLLRALSDQGSLAVAVCGHLLHEGDVRVAPTLSSPSTLRLEPSAYVTDADLDHACAALERVVRIIRDADAHGLLGFLAQDAQATAPRPARTPSRNRSLAGARGPRCDAKVAFVGHFLEPEDVLAWDASLAPLSSAACERLLRRTCPVLEPVAMDEQLVTSATGRTVALTVIGIPLTAEQLLTPYRRGDNAANLERLREAVAIARQRGCTVVGFGGATSIVTNGCRELHASDIGLTTGNSLTAATAMDALELAVGSLGADAGTMALGVVGAMGNLGRALAEMAAERFAEIVLVGRPGAARRLARVADALHAQAVGRLRNGAGAVGIGAAIADERGQRRPVRVEASIDAVAGCDCVLTASNAAEPILFPRHLGERTRVVCDVALPRDVDRSVLRDRPDVLAIRGGLVRLPLGQRLELPGMPAADGRVASCLAETLLLGMAGVREHFSRGPVEAARARTVRELAAAHGFTVDVVEDG